MWTISELKEKGWQKTKSFYRMSVLAALILLMVGDRLGWNFRLDADFTFGQKVNSSDNSLFFLPNPTPIKTLGSMALSRAFMGLSITSTTLKTVHLIMYFPIRRAF